MLGPGIGPGRVPMPELSSCSWVLSQERTERNSRNSSSSGNFYSLLNSGHVRTRCFISGSEIKQSKFFSETVFARGFMKHCTVQPLHRIEKDWYNIDTVILLCQESLSLPTSGPFKLWKVNFERLKPCGAWAWVISTYVATKIHDIIHPLTSKCANVTPPNSRLRPACNLLKNRIEISCQKYGLKLSLTTESSMILSESWIEARQGDDQGTAQRLMHSCTIHRLRKYSSNIARSGSRALP